MNAISPWFRWPVLALSAAVAVGGLTGCAPLLVGGAFFGTVKVATDRRTAETQLVDEAIELRGSNRLRSVLEDRGRINVISFGRRVLLLGEVPTAQDKALAERAIGSVDNVLRVINELSVMPSVPLGQRSEDILITARIKGQILDDKQLTSNAFKIATNRGTVYVMGIVTDRESARAVDIARNTQGVKQVVNMVDLISESDLARIKNSLQTTRTGQAPAAAQPPVAAPVSAAPETPPASDAPPNALPAPATTIAPGQPL